MGIKESSSTLIKLKSSIRYFSFFSKKKMKISYSCLIVAVVIGLGTVTAAPAECQNGERKYDCNACVCSNGLWACTEMYCFDDVKADTADAAKLAFYENDAKLARLVREAAECQNGERKYDCNACVCSNELWACTEMYCFGDVKAVAADAAKLADYENDAKLARLVREAADEGRQMAGLQGL